MQQWLREYPNTVTSLACGDWFNGIGTIKLGYKVFGLKISTEKKIELYNFFNIPNTVVKRYDCFLTPVVNTNKRLETMDSAIRMEGSINRL